MGKGKEKYYNFIVDDLVKKTEIDHEQEKITPPFSSLPYSSPVFFSFSFFSRNSLFLPISSPFHFFFGEHCRDIYGLNEDEVENIWDYYIERVLTIIDNE